MTMSQSTLTETLPETNLPENPALEASQQAHSPSVASRPMAADLRVDDEFHYKPIPVLSPVTLILGLASLIVFVSEFGIILGAIGAILGVICFQASVRKRKEVGGFVMTVCGLILCSGTALYGSTKLVYDYQTELPEGFQRVSFSNDIAEKGLTYVKGQGSWAIPDDVKKLDGQAIFLKGFMYPTRQQEGITEFIMAKDNGECCFGGEPKVTDMILVKMDKPLAVDFTDKRVSVAGTFSLTRNQSEGLTQVYEMQVSHFEISKTAF